MRRIAIVMSHASRAMTGALRDIHLAAAFRALGVDARLWRIHPGTKTLRADELGVPLSFCPSDNPEAIPHNQTSRVLKAELAGFAPDAVLYKGMGYDVNADTQAALPAGTRHGFIVGGGIRDTLLDGAALILGEYREQLLRCFPGQMRAGQAMVLPKHVDLALAGDGTPPAAPDFAVVNVGNFNDGSKNQAALLPLAKRHRVVLVGGGTKFGEMRRAARKLPNLEITGRLPHPEVFGVLQRSAMMVHTSLSDGLPRATIEAMACGLPVIAYRTTIDGGIPAGCGLLVVPEAMPHAVEMLLADPGLRIAMGQAARRYVARHHGPKAIAAAAEQALEILRK